ncbi:MAG: CheR family methyltransferase [Myxococcales bacterium]
MSAREDGPSGPRTAATTTIDQAVARLGRILLERIGMRPASETGAGLRLALMARMAALGVADPERYVDLLGGQGGDEELRALMPLVTVGKTEFFRDAAQFKALRKVIPDLLKQARREMRRLRIWSAGCATGEEPYSLAMVLADLDVEMDGADILATDVNPQAVEVAAAGRFAPHRMGGVPDAALERHFTREGPLFQARPELRARVRFQPHNLAGHGHYPLPKDGPPWDLILCRNVLIYFEREGMVRVLQRFHDALAEGGFLALGYSESLFRVSIDFVLTEVQGAFLYRRPGAAPAEPSKAVKQVKEEAKPPARSATPRLTPKHHPRLTPRMVARASAAPAAPAAPHEPLEDANQLMEQGRFSEAAKRLEKELAKAPENLALLLTHGNLMLVVRDLATAQADYRKALEVEPLCAEAHLFLGIACSEQGDRGVEEALREVNRAIFLAPNLALAHYWSGRLAERLGDHQAARRAYRNTVEATKGVKEAPLLGFIPDLPADPTMLARAARYALAALEEH